MREIDFIVAYLGSSDRGDRYQVLHGEKVIIKSTRVPEFDACRWAKENTDAEVAHFKWLGSDTINITMGVSWGAERTIAEGNSTSLRVTKWKPYDKG